MNGYSGTFSDGIACGSAGPPRTSVASWAPATAGRSRRAMAAMRKARMRCSMRVLERTRVDHIGRGRTPAPGRRDRVLHVLQAAGGVRVGRADQPDPGGERVADVFGAEVQAQREAVDLQRHV